MERNLFFSPVYNSKTLAAILRQNKTSNNRALYFQSVTSMGLNYMPLLKNILGEYLVT